MVTGLLCVPPALLLGTRASAGLWGAGKAGHRRDGMQLAPALTDAHTKASAGRLLLVPRIFDIAGWVVPIRHAAAAAPGRGSLADEIRTLLRTFDGRILAEPQSPAS
jgi:hypothetical protein